MSWKQSLCVPCWNIERPESPTAGLGDIGPRDRCCKCGNETRSGIYVNLDPATVPFPRALGNG